ncbi:MAG: ABC transporter substrate-binding protein [Desulfobacterales bacterium]
MKTYMKTATTALCGLLLFCASGYTAEPVYIGLSAPMTGQYAQIGRYFQEGAELAIENVNRTGGIDGRQMQLISEDSQGLPEISKRIAAKFTNDQRIVAEIGDFTSECSLMAQSVYRKAGMVQLSPTVSHPQFAPGSLWSFTISGSQEARSLFMAHTAFRILGKKRLAILYVNDEWGIAVKKYFAEAGKQLGAEIVGEETYFKNTKDFAPILEKLRTAKPDFLCLGTLVYDAALICRQRQKLGWNDVTVMASGAVYMPAFTDLGGDAVEGVYTSAFFYPKDSRPEIQQFVKSYESAFHQTPTWFAASAYDTVNLLAQSIRKAGTDRQAVRNALACIRDFPGITGNITFREHGCDKSSLFCRR